MTASRKTGPSSRRFPKRTRGLAYAVAEQIRQAIFAGTFAPGALLREIALARQYRVSQATIREALQQLEAVGLVLRTPRVGTAVTRLTPKEIRERVELRTMLEVLAATQAAERMSPADFAELHELLRNMQEAVRANDYYGAAQADFALHRFIWSRSGNGTLVKLLEIITVPLFAFVSLLRSLGLQNLPDVTAAHEPLIEALKSKDPARIAEAFGDGASATYLEFMDTAPSLSLARAFGVLSAER